MRKFKDLDDFVKNTKKSDLIQFKDTLPIKSIYIILTNTFLNKGKDYYYCAFDSFWIIEDSNSPNHPFENIILRESNIKFLTKLN